MNFIKLLSFIMIVLMNNISSAQRPKMINYTTTDGISGSEVFDIIQDDRGYIWTATNNGICKFNGKDFKSYYKRDGLPDNSVIEFYKDSKGKVWMTFYNNELAYLDGDHIYLYRYNYKLKDYMDRQDYCITSLAILDESMYFGWKSRAVIKIDEAGEIDTIKQFPKPGFYYYRLPGNEFVFSYDQPHETNYCTEISEKDTSYFIYPFNKKNDDTNLQYECATFHLRHECATYYHNTVISYGKLLYLINNSGKQDYKLFESDITKLRYDNNGNLLVCTYNSGLFIFPDSKINKNRGFNILKEKTITSVFQDNADGYWISTLKNGIYYIPLLDFHVLNKEDGLIENFVNNITEGNNKIWFSTIHNSVGYINNNKVKQFDLSKINSFKISNITFDIEEEKLWGSFEGGYRSLFNVDKDTFNTFKNTFKNTVIKNKAIQNFSFGISSIIQNNDSLLLGGPFGLGLLEKSKMKSMVRTLFLVINTMDFGKTNNEIWIGNRDGLYFYKNDSVTYLGERDKLFKKRVIKLQFEKSNNQLWVATKDSGIYVLRNDTVKHITVNEGLSGNNISALYVKDTIIWIGTTKGVDQITITDFNKFNFEIQHFNENKGLVSNIINDIAVIEPNVYVATDKGISFFNYKNVKKNTIPPPVYISGIKINNKDTVIQSSYKLSHDMNNINVKFDGLSYRAPKEVSYQYQLEGLHSEIKTTSLNNLEFLLLAPGSYKFEIYAINEDGIKSKIPEQVQFIIKPPFYKTWWFVVFIIFILIFITGSFFGHINRIKLKEVKKRNMVEKNLIKERQSALAQQMNPHFIFNTLSSIQNYLYKKDRISSSIYLEKFSQLMRNNLNHSQEEFISLNDELKSLKIYIELEQLRLNHKFDFKINVNEVVDIYAIKVPPFLIQPYIENSIWHGISQKEENGLIDINFKTKYDYIICTIIDNGIGRKASIEINKRKRKSHISLGGQITEKRLELFNRLYNRKLTVIYSDLTNKNGGPTGTKVELTVPAFDK